MPDLELLSFPRHIQLQTHSRCNMACSMCPHPELRRNDDKERMPWARFVRLMEECHAHPEFREIVLDLQNEPMLDPELEERVRWIKQLSGGRTFVGITTNGLALERERAAALIDAGIDTIVVSLNAATARTFAQLVPRARFDRVSENVDAALALPGGPKTLLLSFGYSDTNLAELEPFLDTVRARGTRYRVFPFHDRTGTVRHSGFLDVPVEPTCHLPLFSLAIHHDGDAILCCQDWTRQRVLGNVFETSVASVWRSEPFVAIRRAAALGEALPARPCGSCKAPVHLHRIRPLHRQLSQLQGLRRGRLGLTPRYVFVPGHPDQLMDLLSETTVELDRTSLVACGGLAAGDDGPALEARAVRAGYEPHEIHARVAELRRRGIAGEEPGPPPHRAGFPRPAWLVAGERTQPVAVLGVDASAGEVRVQAREPAELRDVSDGELWIPLIGDTVMPKLRGRVVARVASTALLRLDGDAMDLLLRVLAADDVGHPLALGGRA